jgi:hypothetical protein
MRIVHTRVHTTVHSRVHTNSAPLGAVEGAPLHTYSAGCALEYLQPSVLRRKCAHLRVHWSVHSGMHSDPYSAYLLLCMYVAKLCGHFSLGYLRTFIRSRRAFYLVRMQRHEATH